jgi:hypothetical protein
MQTPSTSPSSRRGIVVVTQEHRFQLEDDEGNRTLCVVAPHVPVGVDQLGRWAAAGTPVEIRGEPSKSSRAIVAVAMRPLTES